MKPLETSPFTESSLRHPAMQSAPLDLSTVPLGTAAMLLLFSAMLRVGVDVTYIIGALMLRVSPLSVGGPLAVGVFHVIAAVTAYRPLRRGETKARRAAAGSALFLLFHASHELWLMIEEHAHGYRNTELQICLLAILSVSLILTLVYLARGAAGQRGKFSSSRIGK